MRTSRGGGQKPRLRLRRGCGGEVRREQGDGQGRQDKSRVFSVLKGLVMVGQGLG
jgi:hypothetical protein